MNRVASILFLTFAVASCGDHGSVAPATTAPSPLPLTPTQPRNEVASISGFVLDTGYRVLAGARVEVVEGSPQAGISTTTDETGQFSLVGTFDSSTTFRATKDRYVAATQAWNCSIGAGCSARGARPYLGFYLASLASPVNIAGDYTVTFVADRACTDFPDDVRTRTYAATITPSSSPSSSFTLTASGASFLGNLNNFPIGVVGDYVDLWLHGGHDPALVEQLAPNTYLAFSGNATASVGTSPVSSISMPFDGWIDYCVLKTPMGSHYNCGTSDTTGEPIPGLATTYAHCESKNHQLLLMRR